MKIKECNVDLINKYLETIYYTQDKKFKLQIDVNDSSFFIISTDSDANPFEHEVRVKGFVETAIRNLIISATPYYATNVMGLCEGSLSLIIHACEIEINEDFIIGSQLEYENEKFNIHNNIPNVIKSRSIPRFIYNSKIHNVFIRPQLFIPFTQKQINNICKRGFDDEVSSKLISPPTKFFTRLGDILTTTLLRCHKADINNKLRSLFEQRIRNFILAYSLINSQEDLTYRHISSHWCDNIYQTNATNRPCKMKLFSIKDVIDLPKIKITDILASSNVSTASRISMDDHLKLAAKVY